MELKYPPLEQGQYENDYLAECLSYRLDKEMGDLKEALVEIDRGKLPVESIRGNTKRILDVLQEISEKKRDNPNFASHYVNNETIHNLLCVGPLIRTEIPLDVLNQLIALGFNVSWSLKHKETCLDIAMRNRHYNAVRLFIKNGTKNVSNFHQNEIPLITRLASQPGVPLDLFDLLATPENLNGYCYLNHLPLHEAVSHGHAATALHLIKLGASMDQKDTDFRLPIEYFTVNCSEQFNNKLFMRLLPLKAHGVNFRLPIERFAENCSKEFNNKLFLRLLPLKAHGVNILTLKVLNF